MRPPRAHFQRLPLSSIADHVRSSHVWELLIDAFLAAQSVWTASIRFSSSSRRKRADEPSKTLFIHHADLEESFATNHQYSSLGIPDVYSLDLLVYSTAHRWKTTADADLLRAHASVDWRFEEDVDYGSFSIDRQYSSGLVHRSLL